MFLSSETMEDFSAHLLREEKSKATREKYLRDVGAFCAYAGGREVTREQLAGWKKHLLERGYAVRSVNSMLASVNSLLDFLGLAGCKVKSIRIQQQTYCAEEKELGKGEYLRLLEAAQKKEQLYLLLQTICATGIRVSELRHFTVEAVKKGL